jgi:hypothetical protein
MADDLVWMSEKVFKKRFELAFVLKPDLTPGASIEGFINTPVFEFEANIL